ncbi:MAG: hypothetical protein NTV30_05575 [Chloroflexi bacterium]|nr:hypothetical protein [Chloroflexota bacterium]
MKHLSLYAGNYMNKDYLSHVYINLPGPKEPIPGMGGGDLLHGFLGELYSNSSVETKKIIDSLSQRWNVRFMEAK